MSIAELRLRDLGRPLAALVITNLALMLAWSVVLPTFRGADEHVHHDLLRHLTTTWSYPEFDELPVSRRTLATEHASTVSRNGAPAGIASEALEDRSARPSWTELGPDVRDFRRNQIAQHPPLYYVPTAAVLRVIDGDGDAPVDRVVWQLRLLNVLTLIPVPLLAADIARRFTSSRPVVLSAAATTLAVPQLAHVGATVSNDPLMFLLGSVTLAGVARLLTGDRRWGTAVVTGIAAGLALLTKGFSVPLVPAVALAALLPLWHARSRVRGDGDAGGSDVDMRDADLSETDANDAGVRHAGGGRAGVGRAGIVGRSAVLAFLALVLGGWWWIRNIVVHDNPQPGVGLRERVPVDVDVVEFAGDFSSRLIDSFWGNVGWREAQLPLALSVLLTVVLVVAVGAACWGRWSRLVLVIPPAVTGVMILMAGWGAYKKTGVSHATQGRYLFTAIAALAALAALGIARLAGSRTRHQALAVLAVGLSLQAAMFAIAIDRYWAGDGPLGRLRSLVAFSPLPDPATWAILALVPVAAAAGLVSVWRQSQEPVPVPSGRLA